MSQVTQLLSDLIRCPSVTPVSAGALDIVETYLTNIGFTCTRMTFEGDNSYPVENLFATWGQGGKHLLFGGHTDVVPPGDTLRWTHDPFSAKVIDDVMWGRGSVDMKSGVAAFCVAAAEAIAKAEIGEGRISLAITNDEEADGINGTAKIMEWAKARGEVFDFAIVGEPTSAKNVGDRLKIGRRGSYDGHITVRGEQGHVAYPDVARNPVPVLARIAAALSDEPLDMGNERFQASNLEVTTIDVGNPATNVIPVEGSLLLNIRYNDMWNAEKLTAWIEERIARVDAGRCDISFVQPNPASESFVCPPKEPVALMDDIIKDLCGLTAEHSTTGGTSDARFIANYCDVVECGLVGDTMHQIDERVPLEGVETLKQIYTRFICRYLGK